MEMFNTSFIIVLIVLQSEIIQYNLWIHSAVLNRKDVIERGENSEKDLFYYQVIVHFVNNSETNDIKCTVCGACTVRYRDSISKSKSSISFMQYGAEQSRYVMNEMFFHAKLIKHICALKLFQIWKKLADIESTTSTDTQQKN